MNTSALKCFSFCLLALINGIGYARDGGGPLLMRAVYCLRVKGFLPAKEHVESKFGYLVDKKSYPNQKVMYVVKYSQLNHSTGLIFTVFIEERSDYPIFNIQNNASFVLHAHGKDSVKFSTPPLGGVWVERHLISAIEQIAKQPKIVVKGERSYSTRLPIHCVAYTDPQPREKN